MIVVNLVAGPGTGKSTTAAGIFAHLKWADVNAELVTEYAKAKVWENSLETLEDQPYLLGKQHHRLFVLDGKVEVAVTDAPLFLMTFYGQKWGEDFERFTMHLFHRFDNRTFFLERTKQYNPSGRVQTEAKALEIDAFLKQKLEDEGVPYLPVVCDDSCASTIASYILHELHG